MEKFLARLSHYVELSQMETDQIAGLAYKTARYSKGDDIIRSGDPVNKAFVLCSGWAIRFALLEDGRRQILNILLPGDMFDLQVLVAEQADHSVMAVTPVELCIIEPKAFAQLFYDSGRLGLAFWWAAVQEEAILREQIVRNGRRSGRERLVHFVLELHRRACVVGEASGNRFTLPLNQTVIADALGLTNVYTNRIMRTLKREGFMDQKDGQILLKDVPSLVEMSDFDSSYLHLRNNARDLNQLMSQAEK